jgi:hypothetical protein
MNTIALPITLSSAIIQLGRIITRTRRQALVRSVPQHITLQPGEVHRLAPGHRHLRVITGRAWLSQGSRDFVLHTEQQIQLTPNRTGALVSALRNQAVTIELR